MCIPELNTVLQTIAAFGSAIAAIVALLIASSSFSFQKNSFFKQAISEKIQNLLARLHYIRSLSKQHVLDADDDTVGRLPQYISETKAAVDAVEIMASKSVTDDVQKLKTIVYGIDAEDVFDSNQTLGRQVDDALNTLKNIYNKEMK